MTTVEANGPGGETKWEKVYRMELQKFLWEYQEEWKRLRYPTLLEISVD